MLVSVILGHPQGPSLNLRIADAVYQALADNGHRVLYHDLYEESFDPVMTTAESMEHPSTDPLVQKYSTELAESDGIIVIHPVWWGEPPAMVKGWIDRVFTAGKAYRFEMPEGGEFKIIGLLKARAVIIFNTEGGTSAGMDTSAEPLDTLWKSYIFGTCGVQNVERKVFGGVMGSTDEQKAAWLDEVRQTVNRLFPKENAPD